MTKSFAHLCDSITQSFIMIEGWVLLVLRGEPLWPKLYVYVYIGQGPITNLKRPLWLGSAIEYCISLYWPKDEHCSKNDPWLQGLLCILWRPFKTFIILNIFKRSLTWEFRLQVFFISQWPPGLWVSLWDRFEFFRKFEEIIANECLSPVSTTPAKKRKILR